MKYYLMLLLLLSGCAQLKVESEKVNKPLRVAVIGFGINEDRPPGLLEVLTKSKLSRGSYLYSDDAAALDYFAKLKSHFKKELNWDVIDAKAMLTDKVYNPIYITFTGGWQNMPNRGDDIKLYKVSGILDPFTAQKIQQGERQKIAESLGADALMIIELHNKLNNKVGIKSLIGAGDFKPYTTLTMTVWEKDNADPIWFDPESKGKESSEDLPHMLGQTDLSKLKDSFLASAERALDQLTIRARELAKK